jgi:DNA polymerase III subunit gamma/tau
MLDIKYRPKSFKEVVGNLGIVKLLLTRSKNKTLGSRSIMFGGPKGCGKTTLARIVSRAIYCENLNEGEPCNSCIYCQSIIDGSSSSFEEFDAASQGTVDKIRSIVQDLDYISLDGKPKICILDEAQRLSAQAQDALLRPIEDRRLVIILCTTEPNKIRPAVRSRLEEHSVSSPNTDDLVSFLVRVCDIESIKYDLPALKLLPNFLENCPRVCLNSIDTISSYGPISVDAVRSFLRTENYESLSRSLTFMKLDPAKSFSSLDKLEASEGVTWIRDTIVSIVVNEIRVRVGAKSKINTKTDLVDFSSHQLSTLAMKLSDLDKFNIYDLSSILFSILNKVELASAPVFVPSITPTSSSPIPVSVPISYRIPKSVSNGKSDFKQKKSVEVDGVIYSSEETLTSLDHKIEKESNIHIEQEKLSSVEYDGRFLPIPEKEFARGLIKRIKGS